MPSPTAPPAAKEANRERTHADKRGSGPSKETPRRDARIPLQRQYCGRGASAPGAGRAPPGKLCPSTACSQLLHAAEPSGKLVCARAAWGDAPPCYDAPALRPCARAEARAVTWTRERARKLSTHTTHDCNTTLAMTCTRSFLKRDLYSLRSEITYGTFWGKTPLHLLHPLLVPKLGGVTFASATPELLKPALLCQS